MINVIQIVSLIIALLVGSSHSAAGGGQVANESEVNCFFQSFTSAIINKDTNFLNALLSDNSEVIGSSDQQFMFGSSDSVRSILLNESLKIQVKKVKDWSSSDRELYQIFYIAGEQKSIDQLNEIRWMKDYAVCLFEYKLGQWSVPYTICYSETDFGN